MNYRKNILMTILLYGSGLIIMYAQQTIPAGGGNASGGGGTVSYTIDQLVYTTNTGASGSVAQGVQQPFEISTVTGIKEAKGITLQCVVYPNPTSDYIVLKIEDYNIDNLFYRMYDINGSLIENNTITGSETKIVMNHLASALYYLSIMSGDNNEEIKTFKIIKK